MMRNVTVSMAGMAFTAAMVSVVGASSNAFAGVLTAPDSAVTDLTAAPQERRRPDARRGQGAPRDEAERRRAEETAFPAELTDRQTRVFALGTSGTLELRTMYGDVSVIRGSGREARVETVRRARGRTEADARRGLEAVTTTVEHRGDRASVVVMPSPGRNLPYRVSVSYVVVVPAGTRVTATTITGQVDIGNVTGEINALTTAGNITISGAGRIASAKAISGTVTLTDVDTDESVTVGSMAGRVVLDRVKARRVEVEVMAGDVQASGIDCRNADISSLSGTIVFAGRLQNGGRYQLRSHSGDIRLTLGGAGYDLEAKTFNGQIRPAAELRVADAVRTRTSLRGTVGDGGALVTAQTFSGSVDIAAGR
jgi:hypothetical protein